MIADDVLRAVNGAGVDVTRHQWPSDSTGFYMIETVRRAHRNSKVVALQPNCAQEKELPIFRIYETRLDVFGNELPKSLSPIFRHTITCEVKK